MSWDKENKESLQPLSQRDSYVYRQLFSNTLLCTCNNTYSLWLSPVFVCVCSSKVRCGQAVQTQESSVCGTPTTTGVLSRESSCPARQASPAWFEWKTRWVIIPECYLRQSSICLMQMCWCKIWQIFSCLKSVLESMLQCRGSLWIPQTAAMCYP